MKYLKLVNCPIRGLFPEKAKRAIDWEATGLNHPNITRDWVQGYDTVENTEYVSLFGIADEAKLAATGIVDAVNNNPNPDDTAGIIDEAAYLISKGLIESVRDAQ